MADLSGRVPSPEQSDYDLACYFVADLESRLEGAYISGDQALRKHLSDMFHRAMGLRSRCYDRLRATQPPSFEDILRDPTSQMDKDGEVARSILDFHRRTVCGATIEVRSNTAGGVPAVIPPSRYICTKPMPCPDHGVSAPAREPSTGDSQAVSSRG